MSPTASDELLTGCKFVSVQCEFSYAGCKAHMPRKDMAIHMKVKQDHHIKLLVENVSMQNRQIEKLTVMLRDKDKETAHTIQQMQEEFTLKLQSKDEETTEITQQKQHLISIPDLENEEKSKESTTVSTNFI